MALQYRYVAKEALKKATALLDANDDDKLRYACLELRQCLEALAYELLTGYLAEVPLKALATWQPDKVMRELLAIDPEADRSKRIRFKKEGSDGAPDGPWQELGEDRRMDARRLAKAYHRLGNFLHVPTIKQAQEEQTFDATTARKRAAEMVSEVATVLNAQVWNANFSVSVTYNCSECEAPIKRRVSALDAEKEIECGNCGQKFTVEPKDDGSYFFVPARLSWTCSVCKEPRELMEGKAAEGLDVSCPNCKDPATLKLQKQWRLERTAEGTAKPADSDRG